MLAVPFPLLPVLIRLLGQHYFIITLDDHFKFPASIHVGTVQHDGANQSEGFNHRQVRLVAVLGLPPLDGMARIGIPRRFYLPWPELGGLSATVCIHQGAGLQNQPLDLQFSVDQGQKLFLLLVLRQLLAKIHQRGVIGHRVLQP